MENESCAHTRECTRTQRTHTPQRGKAFLFFHLEGPGPHETRLDSRDMVEAWVVHSHAPVCPAGAAASPRTHSPSSSHPHGFLLWAALTLALPAPTPTFALGCESFPLHAHSRTPSAGRERKGGFPCGRGRASPPGSSPHTAASGRSPWCRLFTEFLQHPRRPLPADQLQLPSPSAHFSDAWWGVPVDQLQPAHALQKFLCRPISCSYRPTPSSGKNFLACRRPQVSVAAMCSPSRLNLR